MPLEYYFAYGSNILHARLAARIPLVDDLGSASVRGWQLRFDKRGRDGSGKCTLVTGSQADVIGGALYTLIPGALATLDQIEGVGHGYARVKLTLPMAGPAWCYIADNAYRDPRLLPYRWYRDIIVAGARQRAFPPEYIDALRAVPVCEDPDAARDRAHRALWA